MARRLSSQIKKEILNLFIDRKYSVDQLSIKFECTNATITRNLKKELGNEKYQEIINLGNSKKNSINSNKDIKIEQNEIPFINKVRVLPGSAIPWIVGVVSEVDDVNVVITGASGAIVSRLRVIEPALSFSFPAASLNFDEETLITPSAVLLSEGVNVAW